MPLALPVLALALTLLGSAAQAQQAVTLPAAVGAAADRITAEQVGRDLEYLASDELLGRNTPSPGLDSASAFVARRLERAGLTPLGDEGTFFQHYDLREERVDTAAAYLEIDGRRFRFGDGFVLRSFAGPLSGALPVVYVGHGWTVPGQGVDPYAGLDVRGKLVLAHGPRALPRDVEIQQVGRHTPNASSPFTEAQRRGAAGILFVTQAEALPQLERRGANTVLRELEPSVPSAYAALPVTSLLLAPSTTEALLAGDRVRGAELIARGDAADYPVSFQLARTVRVHVPTAASLRHRPYNVVALLEGSDPVLRHEYVTIAAHLDGAVGTAVIDGDGIYNSADDNASGSAAVLAVAEQLARAPRPRRSLIFLWDSGEEQGLWGTRHFVHRPPVPLESIVAHFNVDMVGATRAPGTPDSAALDVTGPNEVHLIGPGVLSAQIEGLIEGANRAYGRMVFDRRHDRADSEFFYPRTDAGPFLERGIPTIGFTTGIHDRYHLPADEARYLDPEKIQAVARAVLVSAWTLADSPERPRIDRGIPPTVPRYR
jgi:hypothetical protein